jgi:hypothetical protein
MQKNFVSSFSKITWIFILSLLVCSCQTSRPENNSVIATTATITETKFTQPTQTISPSPTVTSTNRPEPTNTALPPTEPLESSKTPNRLSEGIEAVTITTEDRLDLAGFLHKPENPINETLAVVLAHEYYSTHHSWDWLAKQLMEAGVTSLTFE